MSMKNLNWRDDWPRLLAIVSMAITALALIRGGVPPVLAFGIPVALLLVALPSMYYMLRDRQPPRRDRRDHRRRYSNGG